MVKLHYNDWQFSWICEWTVLNVNVKQKQMWEYSVHCVTAGSMWNVWMRLIWVGSLRKALKQWMLSFIVQSLVATLVWDCPTVLMMLDKTFCFEFIWKISDFWHSQSLFVNIILSFKNKKLVCHLCYIFSSLYCFTGKRNH